MKKVAWLLFIQFVACVSGWAATNRHRARPVVDPRLRPASGRPPVPPAAPSFRRGDSRLFMGLRGKKIRRLKRAAAREPTPPKVATPYGAVRVARPPQVCDACRGRGRVRCDVCAGRGVVRATGPRRHNSYQIDRLVQSQWTSVETYNGHRHHTIVETRGSRRRGTMEVRMRNCCGEQQDFWIPEAELREKRIWRMGWRTLDDILRAKDRNGGALIDAKVCFRCKGDRILPCVECDGQGEIPSYEPLYPV